MTDIKLKDFNCTYCNTQCSVNDFRRLYSDGGQHEDYYIFECQSCKVKYTFITNKEILIQQSIKLYTIINSIEYQILLRTYCNETSISYRYDPFKTMFSQLCSFNKLLNVNPLNINDKLKTIILFS